MVNLITNSPSGWNKWIYASSTFGVEVTANEFETINLPDADFPVLYTPSSAFFLRSVIDNCISWIQVLDPFTIFLISGGGSATLIGALSGLAAVGGLADIYAAGGTFGIFPKRQGGAGPRLGYNIGTQFKQQIYVTFILQNAPFSVILLGSATELMENSRFKRLYLYEGEVLDYETDSDGNHKLRLDINKPTIPDGLSDNVGGSIKIIKSDGSSFSLSINGIENNWDLIVSTPSGDDVPETGDYYVMDKIWIMEDPALLSGFLDGSESEASDYLISVGLPNSGLDLYLSDKNKPYSEGKFLGAYIWSEVEDEDEEDDTETATSDYTQPSYGSNMRDSATNTWGFLGFGNADESITYSNDTRYVERLLDDPDGETASVTVHEVRQVATISKYVNARNGDSTDYLRVELSEGGYITRNNWQAPALKGSYIHQGSNVFRILDHVESNIVDVAMTSVDGNGTFDPLSNQAYTIVNQHAWIINENYMGFVDERTLGVFEGAITSVSGNKVTVEVVGDPSVLTGDKKGYSFIGRYKDGVDIPGGQVQAFNRFQDWRLVDANNGTSYIVDDSVSNAVTFSDSSADVAFAPYSMTVNLESDVSDSLSAGQTVYMAFDKIYETVGNTTSKGFGILLDGFPANSGTGASGFVTTDQYCLDGQFLSAPYDIDIPLNTR